MVYPVLFFFGMQCFNKNPAFYIISKKKKTHNPNRIGVSAVRVVFFGRSQCTSMREGYNLSIVQGVLQNNNYCVRVLLE